MVVVAVDQVLSSAVDLGVEAVADHVVVVAVVDLVFAVVFDLAFELYYLLVLVCSMEIHSCDRSCGHLFH